MLLNHGSPMDEKGLSQPSVDARGFLVRKPTAEF
jgi:hypothetical protein